MGSDPEGGSAVPVPISCKPAGEEKGMVIKMGKEENEKNEKSEKNEKKKKTPKKGSHMFRTLLGVVQHLCLGILVLAMVVVVGGSTVRVQGFKRDFTFSIYAQDKNRAYEESDIFNSIFGYAAADIIRYGVVSSQLETDGKFDGGKAIDVTAYNYRDIGLPERYVTADYQLEDLLKWAHHGFEWSASEMTQTQAQNFLADKTRVTFIDPKSEYYNTSDASYLKSDIGSYTFVNDVSSNRLWVDMDDYDGFVNDYRSGASENVEEADIAVSGTEAELSVLQEQEDSPADDGERTYNVMVNRYKTTEGKNLEEYVSNWATYYDLCHSVQNAAKSLSYNYSEYLNYGEYYSRENSNLRYLILKTVGDDTQIYSNLDDTQAAERVAAFMGAGDSADRELPYNVGKYIYYSPADMVYRSNTTIAEETIRKILQDYDYAYPETVKIWMGVDTSYPVNDAFKQGAAGFSSYLPYFWQCIVIAAAAFVLYLLLLCYLTAVTGRDTDEAGNPSIRLQPFDAVPTEVALLIAFGVMVLAAWALIVATELANVNPTDISEILERVLGVRWVQGLLLAGVFAADAVAMFFFYSLVRRIKAHTLWKNSYLYRLIQEIRRFAWKVYDNGHAVLRTWVPYGIFLLFNFLMLVFAFDVGGFGCVAALLVAVAFDMLIGNVLYRNAKEQQDIVKGIETIAGGQLEYQVDTSSLHGDNLILAHSVNSIGKGIKEAVEISMKDERMKADLITNVSHDIKTPLTSIINYVDLIKREQVDNDKVQNYIRVLDEKSQRLKQLTDDLVEASKITSGNISLHFEKINLTELLNQTVGEFSEKFEEKRLTTVMNVNVHDAVIEADSRRIWRVMENLFNNIFKYAMEGTRVYLAIDSLPEQVGYIAVSVKNISASPLNCNPDELTERFIRGDESRTTEGSGLGLSIAKNLTEAQGGTFEIRLDGDLFKVILTFPLAEA